MDLKKGCHKQFPMRVGKRIANVLNINVELKEEGN